MVFTIDTMHSLRRSRIVSCACPAGYQNLGVEDRNLSKVGDMINPFILGGVVKKFLSQSLPGNPSMMNCLPP